MGTRVGAYGEAAKAKGGYGKGAYKVERGVNVKPVRSPRPAKLIEQTAGGYIQGRKATSLEMMIYNALLKLGWSDSNIKFQQSILGGKGIPGGRSIDFVVWSPGMPIMIEANGDYWHTSSLAKRESDRQREAQIRQIWRGHFRYVAILGSEVPDLDTAIIRMAKEVGRA